MIIGGVTLDRDMVWTDEFKFTLGTGKAERTIYGNELVQTFKVIGGRPMTLEGTISTGWQKRSTLLSLLALSESPETVYTVELPDTRTFQVMFKNEDAPVIEFQPITTVTSPDGDFWYYGTIKLRIIE